MKNYIKTIIITILISMVILFTFLFLVVHSNTKLLSQPSVTNLINILAASEKVDNAKHTSNDDVKVYENLFRGNTPSNKNELLQRLEKIEESERLKCYLNILTNGTIDTVIDNDDQGHVAEIIWKIGILARTNDTAYAFLKESVKPGYWKSHRVWRREPLDGGYNYTLAQLCISALVFSARPEVRQIVLSLMEVDDLNYLKFTSGMLVESMWLMEIIEKNGLQWFESHDDDRLQILSDWMRNSEEGRKWVRWMADVHGKRSDNK
jgi:hypothetical protein